MIRALAGAILYLLFGGGLIAGCHVATGRTQFVVDSVGEATLSSAISLAVYFVQNRWLVAAVEGIWIAVLVHRRNPLWRLLILAAAPVVVMEFLYVLNRPGPRASISGVVLRGELVRYAIPVAAGVITAWLIHKLGVDHGGGSKASAASPSEGG